MADWEEDAKATASAPDNWDDEKADDIPDSWDADEPEEKPAEPVKPAPKAAPTKAAPAKAAPAAAAAAKGKAAPKKADGPRNTMDDLEDMMTIRERERRQVEGADYENAVDLFAGVRSETSATVTLDSYQPKTAADFNAYAELLSKKFKTFEKDPNYLPFLKQLIRLSTAPLKSLEVSEVNTVVSAVFNETQKKEKAAKGKTTKAPAKKPTAMVEKDDYVNDNYDDDDGFF